MRWLMVAVVTMGVLIVAGTAVLGVLIIRRVGGGTPAAFSAVLDEPAGTHIAGVAGWPDHLAITLSGGGTDRVVLVDPRSGRTLGRIGLQAATPPR